ncbi:MAG TPA: hypothetical protein VM683_06015 [Anaeromyxobacteraceae bacterium]|jgi:hypothetical protein|nr:hypothetical protein [Anaeromyxobacteraceae bacterium]
MRETTKESPVDRGEVVVEGRCQICGLQGQVLGIPGAPQPNQFCERCAIEYAEAPGSQDDDEGEVAG